MIALLEEGKSEQETVEALKGRYPEAELLEALDECRELARGHYPEIRQYDLIRRTAEYDLSNARRAWLPQLSLSAQATWQTDVPGFPREMTGFLAGQGLEIPGLNRDQYKAQLELSQTIWDGGRSSADKRMAEAEAAEAEYKRVKAEAERVMALYADLSLIHI